jgi:arylamine N-acetyltransferase
MLPIKHCPSPFFPSQVVEYLQAINFEPLPVWRAESVWDGFDPNLETLEKLMRLHVIAFPYENTEDHYSAGGRICWKEQDVFRRLVTEKKGYGTVCFGHSFLFRGVLRALGYRAITSATRNNATWNTKLGPPDLTPIGHAILLATVPGHEFPFLVDVGFGGIYRLSLLSKPIPLVPGVVADSFTPPEEHRLAHGDNSDSSLEPDPRAPHGWWLQARHSPDAAWRTVSYFTLEEYTEKDFEYFVYSMSTMADGPGLQKLFCIKVAEGPTGILERYAVAGKVATKQVGCEEKVVVETFKWEHERVDAIRRLCGIQLDAAAAVKHMAGSKIALPIQALGRL